MLTRLLPALWTPLPALGLLDLSVFAAPGSAAPEVAGLRCEFMKTPLGIDDARPALSWIIRDERRRRSEP